MTIYRITGSVFPSNWLEGCLWIKLTFYSLLFIWLYNPRSWILKGEIGASWRALLRNKIDTFYPWAIVYLKLAYQKMLISFLSLETKSFMGKSLNSFNSSPCFVSKCLYSLPLEKQVKIILLLIQPSDKAFNCRFLKRLMLYEKPIGYLLVAMTDKGILYQSKPAMVMKMSGLYLRGTLKSFITNCKHLP